MPIYEYACDKCRHEFEVEQRITEDPVKTCPSCRSRKVKRLISRTSFVLKGGGWYSDLYASTGKDAKKDAAEGGSDGKDGKDSKDGKDEKDGKDGKDKGEKSEKKSSGDEGGSKSPSKGGKGKGGSKGKKGGQAAA